MSNHEMGEFLAALRKSKGYTQLEAANLLGVSNKTVSSWETGASCPDISMLPALAVELLVVYPVRLHMRKQAAQTSFQTANDAAETQAAKSAQADNAKMQTVLRSQKRYRTALLLFGIPLLVAAAAILSLAVAIDQNPEGMYSMYTKNFDTRESMIDFAENSELFSER